MGNKLVTMGGNGEIPRIPELGKRTLEEQVSKMQFKFGLFSLSGTVLQKHAKDTYEEIVAWPLPEVEKLPFLMSLLSLLKEHENKSIALDGTIKGIENYIEKVLW